MGPLSHPLFRLDLGNLLLSVILSFLPKGTRKIREGVQESQCCGGSTEPCGGATGNAGHVPQTRPGPARPGGLAGTPQKKQKIQASLNMTDMLKIAHIYSTFDRFWHVLVYETIITHKIVDMCPSPPRISSPLVIPSALSSLLPISKEPLTCSLL